MQHKTNDLSCDERVSVNLVEQDAVLAFLKSKGFPNCLRDVFPYLGKKLVVEDATKTEDMEGKTDCYLLDGAKRLPMAIKVRDLDSGKKNSNTDKSDDILVCVYEPYLGINNKKTTKGRDFLIEYAFYICRCKKWENEKWVYKVYVVPGDLVKIIINKMLEELKAIDNYITAKSPLNSRVYPGCMLRTWYDLKNGRQKLCAFLSPESFPNKLEFDYPE